MVSFQAGPSNAPTTPVCHGAIAVFDVNSQTCRQCPFQNSCREKVETARKAGGAVFNPAPPSVQTWTNAQQQTFQQRSPWQTYQPQPQFQQPVYQQQYQIPQQQVNNQYQQTQFSPHLQQNAQLQQQAQTYGQFLLSNGAEYYGRVNDPLYVAMKANPSPMRYQMPGESFVVRVGKNLLLSGLENVFAEAIGAVRQMVMPPKPDINVIDVTPKIKNGP